MPTIAKYFMAAEVRELIENWGRWPGWCSGGGTRSPIAWVDDFVSNKRTGDAGPSIPVMGGEAADTHRALGRIEAHLGQALIVYYTWHGHVSTKLSRLNALRAAADRVSKRTFFRHVATAHPAFMEQYRAVRQEAHIVGAENARAAGEFAGTSVARRHRLVVTPKLGLQAPKKPEA